jgi:adenine phosphoribosyltransferase
MAAHFSAKHVQKVVGIESRGFIFGAPLALLHAGFVPARKPKKLPTAVLREEYQFEYGTDAIEIHLDAITQAKTSPSLMICYHRRHGACRGPAG